MKALLSEFGSFMVEVICGGAVLAAAITLWPTIQAYMDKIIYLLI
jgi:hypothetical protein